jgi:hypothetical protein
MIEAQAHVRRQLDERTQRVDVRLRAARRLPPQGTMVVHDESGERTAASASHSRAARARRNSTIAVPTRPNGARLAGGVARVELGVGGVEVLGVEQYVGDAVAVSIDLDEHDPPISPARRTRPPT